MSNTQYAIQVDAGKLTKRLSIIASLLLFEHGLMYTWHYLVQSVPWYVLQFFDVDEENNLPTWFSGFNLLVATTFLGILLRDKQSKNDPMAGRWKVLFIGFFFLSIDEIAGIHETINSVITPTWAYGGAAISFILLIYFLSFLKSLPRETMLGFFFAGVIFVAGSVGMEFVGDPMLSNSLAYKYSTMIEEGMEMFGIILFTWTLLRYMDHPLLVIGISRE